MWNKRIGLFKGGYRYFGTKKLTRDGGHYRSNHMATRYLSVKEVATLLGVSNKTIYAKKLSIPGYFNLAGMPFFDEEVLVKSLKDLATKPFTKPIELVKTNRKRPSDRHGLGG